MVKADSTFMLVKLQSGMGGQPKPQDKHGALALILSAIKIVNIHNLNVSPTKILLKMMISLLENLNSNYITFNKMCWYLSSKYSCMTSWEPKLFQEIIEILFSAKFLLFRKRSYVIWYIWTMKKSSLLLRISGMTAEFYLLLSHQLSG